MDNASNDFENTISHEVPAGMPEGPTTPPVDPVTPPADPAGRPTAGDHAGAPATPAAEAATAAETSVAYLTAYLAAQHVDLDLAGELRSIYIKSGRDETLRRALDEALKRIGLRRRDGTPFEGLGIALVAESGAGKTQAVRRCFENHPVTQSTRANLLGSVAISVTCLGSCTVRILGEMILRAAGYPIKRGLRENEIWSLVRHHLEMRGILILHIDEVSNLIDNANDLDRQRIVNNFKALINNASWPVVLVLSGIPSIGPVLKADMQLRRRLTWLEFKPLQAPQDNATLALFAKKLCATAGIEPMAGFAGELAPRLIHASCSQLGLAAEMCVEGVEHALRDGHDALGLENFAAMFAVRTGCDARHNPFANADWTKTDPRVALGMVQGEGDDDDGGDGPSSGKPGPTKPTKNPTTKKGKR